MKKIIIVCPSCKNKMKITDKIAKYKCPHCSAIYKLTIFNKYLFLITAFFKTISNKINGFFYGIKRKYQNAKATYKYMKQLREHMKNDPNWSQYRTQQREAKDVTPKKSFKDFFKKKK